MNDHWLKLQPQEPLLLGQGKADTRLLDTLSYIPGRLLRGAWADWLITEGKSTQIIPTVQEIQIGNFFPSSNWRSISYVSPFLLSMMTCRHQGGFRDEPGREDEKGHGVIDTLLPHLAYHLLHETGAAFPIPFTITCERCGGRLEPELGFFSLFQDNKKSCYVKTRLMYYAHTRVALSRYRRTASEGMLYSATALSPQTRPPDGSGRAGLIFTGRIQGPEEKVDEVIRALNQVAIGGMRTRGYGKITVEKTDISLPSMAERLQSFNAILAELWIDLKRLANNTDTLPDKPEGSYFSVDLIAPAIFRERGVPSLIPVLKVAGQELRPIFWLTRPALASGWSEAWGLPKPTALTACMGSIYVFRWDRPQDDTFFAALERLEAEGVGERCDESFGECWICHPFHQEVKER